MLGLLQVNVVVPRQAALGEAVPVSLSVGDFTSPEGVTVAVR